MMGLVALGILLAVGVVVIAAVGFVTLAVATVVCRLMVQVGPLFGRMVKTGGFLTAALLMAVWSVDIVAGEASHPDSVFAFVRPAAVMSVQDAEPKSTSKPKHDSPQAEKSTAKDSTAIDTRAQSPKTAERFEVTAVPQTHTDTSLPKWAQNQRKGDGETTYHVVKSKLTVTKEEAIADIHEQAAKIIRDDFTSHNSADVNWELPRQVVEDSIRRTYPVKETVNLTSSVTQEMHTVYAQISVSPSMRNAIYPGWKKLVASQRLVKLGQGFGIVTLVLMSLATYLRFDKQTLGKKKGRLGVLSLAILASGSVAVGALGDTLKAKLASAGIVETEYLRDRVQLEDTVISLDEGPLIDVTEDDSRIVILIDNAAKLERPHFISERVTKCIEGLPVGTVIDVHATTGDKSKVGFVGGTANRHDIDGLLSRRGQPTRFSGVLQRVIDSRPDSVYVVTEGMEQLSASERSEVHAISSRVPISFIKLIDDGAGKFDESLRDFATGTGGYLRFLNTDTDR